MHVQVQCIVCLSDFRNWRHRGDNFRYTGEKHWKTWKKQFRMFRERCSSAWGDDLGGLIREESLRRWVGSPKVVHGALVQRTHSWRWMRAGNHAGALCAPRGTELTIEFGTSQCLSVYLSKVLPGSKGPQSYIDSLGIGLRVKICQVLQRLLVPIGSKAGIAGSHGNPATLVAGIFGDVGCPFQYSGCTGTSYTIIHYILLMVEILHQLIDSLSHYLYTGFYTSQVVQDFFHQLYT